MAGDDDLEALARSVIDCAFHIHRDLGPGLLESAYELILIECLHDIGIACQKQVSVPIRYGRIVVDNAFRIDLLIENRLIVELKSIDQLLPLHGKQVLTYLRLMKLPLGLLMNFGQGTFKDGLRRIANDYFGFIPKR
jgi:GxxExxY protein